MQYKLEGFVIFQTLGALTCWWVIHAAAVNPQARCTQIDMRAQQANCTKTGCQLVGNAYMRCDSVLLWADTIDLRRTPSGAFDGAEARGNARLLHGKSIINSEHLQIAADTVVGQVDDATIEIRRTPATFSLEGIEPGPNQMILHGDLTRLDERYLRMDHGNFTLCDCGHRKCPSWRFDSPRIDVALGERATIWWPQLLIHPWGLGMVEITPPLAPISLPLVPRATGFLPPELQLLKQFWPTVDLPFFVPLGPSWDIKLSLGVRSDWQTPSSTGVQALGAPRLGLRLRYAPIMGTQGTFSMQLTHDGDRAMVYQFLQSMPSKYDPTTPDNQIILERQRALVDRINIAWQHQSSWREQLDLVADARWLSDDLVNRNFAVLINERFANYLPSRAEAVLRRPGFYTAVAADFMQRLDNVDLNPLTQALLPVYSNLNGSENGTMHRGPYVTLNLLPINLGHGFDADAQFSYVRYGTWSATAPAQPLLGTAQPMAEQHITGAKMQAAYHRTWQAVSLSAQSGLDSLLVATDGLATELDTAWTSSADADLRFFKQYNQQTETLHLVIPYVAYRGLIKRLASPQVLAHNFENMLDERLRRQVGHQVLLGLRQSFWQGTSPDLQNIASFEIAQPFDLLKNDILQPWATLSLNTIQYGTGTLWLSFDFHQWQHLPLRELSAVWNKNLGLIRWQVQYDRFAPNADRFERTIYELAAPRIPDSGAYNPLPGGNSAWIHLLRGSTTIQPTKSITATYGTAYQLPRPGQQGGEPACAILGNNLNNQPNSPERPTACFTQHTVSVNYTSPCQCWGIGTTMSAIPQHLDDTLRFQVFLNMGQYSLMAQPLM